MLQSAGISSGYFELAGRSTILPPGTKDGTVNPLEWALLPETCRAILRIFHGFRVREQQIFPKQSWLARTIGVCRLSIVRAVARLLRLGLIRIRRRSRFCEYTLQVTVTSHVTSGVTSHPYNRASYFRRANSGFVRTSDGGWGRPISWGAPGPERESVPVEVDPDLEAFIAAHEAKRKAALA